MAKTFDPNRQGGGTVSIVRDAQGNYVLKETGFDKIAPLQLPELGAVAATTTAAKTQTAADKTGTTTADQTKAAFLLPKKDDKDNIPLIKPEDLNRQATDLSKGLSDVRTATTIQDSMPRSVRTPFTIQDNMPKDPTGPVFGRTPLEDDPLPEAVKLETPQDKLKLSAEEKEKRKPKLISNIGSFLLSRPEKPTETIGRLPSQTKTFDQLAKEYQQDLDRQAMIEGATPDDPIANQLDTLGIRADPTKLDQAQIDKFRGVSELGALAGDEKEDVKPSVKTNALQNFSNSLRNNATLNALGTGARLAATTMSRGLDAVFGVSAAERNYRNTTSGILKSSGYKTRGELGGSTDPDRIAMSPQDSVFGGMNRSGDTIKGANKRISTRSTVGQARVDAKYGKDSKRSKDFAAKTEQYKAELEREQAKVNKATMNKGGPAGGAGTRDRQGCVIATHAVNSGAFTADTKREAVRWCVKNLHRTWWGEAIRRGYRYYGQKAINEGNAKNHYQEFKDYIAFGTGKKRTLKTAWTFIYRTIQFFIKGVIIKK
tara:strand:+ start:227 stop:1855 length:1629 start_codon:yes stop_codon:yes gene_type:complete